MTTEECIGRVVVISLCSFFIGQWVGIVRTEVDFLFGRKRVHGDEIQKWMPPSYPNNAPPMWKTRRKL